MQITNIADTNNILVEPIDFLTHIKDFYIAKMIKESFIKDFKNTTSLEVPSEWSENLLFYDLTLIEILSLNSYYFNSGNFKIEYYIENEIVELYNWNNSLEMIKYFNDLGKYSIVDESEYTKYIHISNDIYSHIEKQIKKVNTQNNS